MKEIWRDIPGYGGLYRISNTGKIKSVRMGKILRPGTDGSGYLIVQLSKDKVQKGYKVHRLVYSSFFGEILPGKEINHKDFNKSNNYLTNLELCSRQENMTHWSNSVPKPNGELRNYYMNLTASDKDIFIKTVMGKCKMGYSTLRSWIADPTKSFARNPKRVYRPILSEITGIPEEKLF